VPVLSASSGLFACRDTSEPGLASLIYRRSGRGSCTRCSVFLRADRSFRPIPGFQLTAPECSMLRAGG
jgi:hypothetical protein